jgi:hypothetical protein
MRIILNKPHLFILKSAPVLISFSIRAPSGLSWLNRVKSLLYSQLAASRRDGINHHAQILGPARDLRLRRLQQLTWAMTASQGELSASSCLTSSRNT